MKMIATASRVDLVEHLRRYGYRHFDSKEAYHQWRNGRIGNNALAVDELGHRSIVKPSPHVLRQFYDLVAEPLLQAPTASMQTDDVAQGIWAVSQAIAQKARVLDLGCGLGQAATWFAKIGGQSRFVVGADFSPKCISAAIDRAKKLKVVNVEFQVLDLNQATPIGTFDAAVDLAAIQYVSNPVGLLQRVRSQLTDDGLFVAAPMLGTVREIDEYLTWIRSADLGVDRFDWIVARDLGRNVARPLIVARKAGNHQLIDVSARFREVVSLVQGGRITPMFEQYGPAGH
jgi:SAM-dependent methyltransferase